MINLLKYKEIVDRMSRVEHELDLLNDYIFGLKEYMLEEISPLNRSEIYSVQKRIRGMSSLLDYAMDELLELAQTEHPDQDLKDLITFNPIKYDWHELERELYFMLCNKYINVHQIFELNPMYRIVDSFKNHEIELEGAIEHDIRNKRATRRTR